MRRRARNSWRLTTPSTLIAMQDGKATIVVGQDDFRVPIPLLSKNGVWRFDAAAGREEVLARRIGENELVGHSGQPCLCRCAV